MRTISREEHELILNLLALEFFGFGLQSKAFEIEDWRMEDLYWMHLKASWFKSIKDCFPMDEVWSDVIVSNVGGITIRSGDYPVNYIQNKRSK